MTPREYGAHLASLAPAITRAQAEAAARILATVDSEQVAA
jgi:hypothetical protein